MGAAAGTLVLATVGSGGSLPDLSTSTPTTLSPATATAAATKTVRFMGDPRRLECIDAENSAMRVELAGKVTPPLDNVKFCRLCTHSKTHKNGAMMTRA